MFPEANEVAHITGSEKRQVYKCRLSVHSITGGQK